MKCDNVNSMSSLRDIFTQNHYVKSIREFITQDVVNHYVSSLHEIITQVHSMISLRESFSNEYIISHYGTFIT